VVRFSAHAAERLRQRGTAEAWVEETLANPDTVQPDPADPSLTRNFRAIAAADNRILRVVHRPDGADSLVITAFFDRDAMP
jgi:hypothetical protein